MYVNKTHVHSYDEQKFWHLHMHKADLTDSFLCRHKLGEVGDWIATKKWAMPIFLNSK